MTRWRSSPGAWCRLRSVAPEANTDRWPWRLQWGNALDCRYDTWTWRADHATLTRGGTLGAAVCGDYVDRRAAGHPVSEGHAVNRRPYGKQVQRVRVRARDGAAVQPTRPTEPQLATTA